MDPAATAEKPNKLIVWLHPSGGQPTGAMMNDKVEAMAPMFLKHGYALVIFTQKNFAGWSDRDVKKLSVSLKKIGKIAGIDAKKPILFGFSAGGQVALGLWKDKPGRFGGLVLDAAYPMIMSPGGYKPMELDADHVDPAVKTVPILALVGGADPGAKSWQVVEANWKQAGVPLELILVPDKRHEWLFDKAQTERLEQWLTQLSVGKLPRRRFAAGVPARAPQPANHSGRRIGRRNRRRNSRSTWATRCDMKLVLIPAGKFMMGSLSSEEDHSNSKTQHEVTLTKPFYMGKYTVTQEQYQQVMGSNPSTFKGKDNPVENVSWDDAQEFIKKVALLQHRLSACRPRPSGNTPAAPGQARVIILAILKMT